MALWSRAFRMGFHTARRALPLMLLPFIFDLLVLLFYPRAEVPAPSVEFSLPLPLPSVAQAYGQAMGATPFFPIYPEPLGGQLTAALLLLLLGVQAYVAAGYLGALEAVRVGALSRHPLRFANLYFSRIFAFYALIGVVLLVMAPFLEGLPSFFVFPGLLVLLYLLFLTPFAIAVDDRPLGAAFQQSVGLALTAWREVLPFCLAWAAATLLLSAAVNFLLPLPVVGLPLAAALVAVLGTALVAATLHLYDGLRPKEPVPATAPLPTPTEEAVPT